MIQIRNMKQVEYSSSQQDIKFKNTRLIFNLIRDYMPISRIDLSRRCTLSVSTVSNLVDDLLSKKWVVETQTVKTSSRGRRSVLLEVNKDCGYVMTIELLSRGYICTIYNICMQKIIGVRMRDLLYDAETIGATIQSLLESAKIATCMLIGIHLIFPGIVDPVSGDLISSSAFPETDILDKHLMIRLQRMFPDSHVMISTNGTIIAYEEFSAQRDYARLPLLSLNIDEAIFGGVVMSNPENNMCFCFPVEIGHTILDYGGRHCKCGNYGCMETLLATPVLFRSLEQKAGLKLEYSELFGADCNVASMKLVADRLLRGDPAVVSVLKEYSDILCSSLISVVNFLNIQSIHIGGDIALLGNPFLQLLRKTYYDNACPLNDSYRTQIELFSSDYEQVRLAATNLCLDAIFRK